MDGKGRATDNAFIERLCRSLKYECIYARRMVVSSASRSIGTSTITTMPDPIVHLTDYRPHTLTLAYQMNEEQSDTKIQ